MIIIYPIEDWNSFVTETEAEAFMSGYVETGRWDDMTTEERESILKQTASQIRLCKNITLPVDNEEDLKQGQLYLILQASRIDMTVHDHNEKYVTGEKVGSIEKTYSGWNRNTSVSDMPDMSILFLTQYGCTGGTGFSQSRVNGA